MNLYRFSPIKNESQMHWALNHVHIGAHVLCEQSFDKLLSTKGNIVIFTHYQDEYDYLCKVREELCEPAEVEGQKYYQLKRPIGCSPSESIPSATYTHVYFRKPDPWRSQVGDLDFHVSESEYIVLKTKVSNGEIPHARVFPEARLDMIELFHPDIDVLAYISPTSMDDIIKITKSGTDAKSN